MTITEYTHRHPIDKFVIQYLKNNGPSDTQTLWYALTQSRIPSNNKSTLSNRLHRLKKQKVIESPAHSVYRVTPIYDDVDIRREVILESLQTILDEHAKGPLDPANPKHEYSKAPYHILYNDLAFLLDQYK